LSFDRIANSIIQLLLQWKQNIWTQSPTKRASQVGFYNASSRADETLKGANEMID